MKAFIASVAAIVVITAGAAFIFAAFDRSSQHVFSTQFVRH
jgi:ABC-type uncharacterized transport system permease subunit